MLNERNPNGTSAQYRQNCSVSVYGARGSRVLLIVVFTDSAVALKSINQ